MANPIDDPEGFRLQCIADACEGKPLQVGNDRAPKFGERMRGIYAGLKNPQRDGMYVETIRRTGRCNNGTWYRLTDGDGKFWEYEAKATVYLSGASQ